MSDQAELTRLREHITHIASQLVDRTKELSELRAEWNEVLERQDALLAKASATLTQAKHQITWTTAVAFVSGIAAGLLWGWVW